MRSDGTWAVADTAAVAQRMRSLRADDGLPFDVAVPGESDPTDPTRTGRFAEHAAAGATWWIEAVHPWRYDYEDGGRLAPRRHAGTHQCRAMSSTSLCVRARMRPRALIGTLAALFPAFKSHRCVETTRLRRGVETARLERAVSTRGLPVSDQLPTGWK